ncbi:acyl carrier protein [Streptomyces amakusaensis]|uniref:Acyl carrier protein n=1 Tax=Streptomyces amakusaensis TaxID=67271 RepID=A0ABW0A8V9_9ACTN
MDIEGTIRKILTAELFLEAPPEEIGAEDSLRAVHGLDSLGFAELRVLCEESFAVRISDDDFTPENFRSLSTVTALVARLRADAA